MTAGRAQLVGAGLIGGSVALGLRSLGWYVTVDDADSERAGAAVAAGVADAAGRDPGADLAVVAVPVGAVAGVASELLEGTRAVVTDVGSVKAGIVAAADHERFVGGHPMAGSEQEGLDGARADMFQGAAWVLTPSTTTSDDSLSLVHHVVTSLGAEVVTLDPVVHDEVVATVSHVPHLAAMTLMGLAADRSVERSVLLRLAAGGFRDMTRITAGHPGIWPDICDENRAAILDTLDDLIDELGQVRRLVAARDRSALLERLERARQARLNLPVSAGPPSALTELRIRIPDRPGQILAITRRAAELGVNIFDVEIAHSTEGAGGVLIIVVGEDHAATLADGLTADGYTVSLRGLE